ncbi:MULTISPECIES: helix-turn-helix domain-containing protein [unclassified Aliihoeflea]|jgi:DNA-binding transcriptional MerR regulator|uniref:MerR family transcriptional regulator n=1 Tax=unclassified Aliihoeflea TaxID=2628764 RepID=UPI0004632508|nr:MULTISPECIES: helix-turn-helix domain-containing protein [unclassified Aliihoeflea]MCO6388921.1 MerR family DNA-binding protein [Aliihoeflea sp. 40Bstr573]
MLTIGDLARDTGVKVPTIRYYEQMGLLHEAGRSRGNQRRYESADRNRLAFIKHARDLGFTIEAIRELLELSAHPEKPCADADQIAARQLEAVRAKIVQLQSLERELGRISSCCHGEQVRDCYVIQSLSNHDLCQTDH